MVSLHFALFRLGDGWKALEEDTQAKSWRKWFLEKDWVCGNS
jgi:hypothetical protein